MKIKADKHPQTRQTGVSLQTGSSLEPRCTPGARRMALPHQAAQGCPGDAWQEGTDALLSSRWWHWPVTHSPSWVALEVAEGQAGCWTPRPATATGFLFLLAKADLPSSSKTGKFSTATYLLKQPFFLSLCTRTELGQHPRLSTFLTAHSNVNNPMHHPQDSHISPGWNSLAVLPHDACTFGFFFLLQDSKAPTGWGSSIIRG